MAKEMTRTMFPDLGATEIEPRALTGRIRRERPAIGHEKERAVIGVTDKLRTTIIQILANPGQCAFTNRHHAGFIAFAVANEERTTTGIDILHEEATEFGAANTTRVERLQHGPIA